MKAEGRGKPENSGQKIGLIAGSGNFPLLFLEEARRRRLRVVAVAVRGEADPRIENFGAEVHWLELGQLSHLIRHLKEAGVSQAVMAGQVKHKEVFRALDPDPALSRVLARLRTRTTDAILGAVAEVLAEEGIFLTDSTALLASLMALEGALSKREPTEREREDIAFGFGIAREIARLDIGQTVVVKAKAVVAVEAMEGTDEAIRRAGEIAGGGLTVVKVARPGQDMRFDVPVVGPRTIAAMAAAGASVLAVEAGKTLLLDREALIARADEAGIALFGVGGAGERRGPVSGGAG